MPQLRVRRNERTVILAGAGFSRCLGAPLQDELLHKLITSDVLLIHRVAYGFPDGVKVGIEDFLAAADFEEAIQGRASEISSKGLRSQIAVEIFNALASAHVPTRALRRFYKNFRTLLEIAGTWITLNWDTLVETICRADDHDFTYRPSSDGLAVLKLHGSIDWFRETSGSDRVLDPAHFTRIFDNYYRFDPFSLLGSTVPDWIDTFIREYPPLILAPSRFKSFGDRFARRMWRWAWSEMAFMDHLIVIGYSLPPADTAMRVLLARMVRRPRRDPQLRVSVMILIRAELSGIAMLIFASSGLISYPPGFMRSTLAGSEVMQRAAAARGSTPPVTLHWRVNDNSSLREALIGDELGKRSTDRCRATRHRFSACDRISRGSKAVEARVPERSQACSGSASEEYRRCCPYDRLVYLEG